MAGANAPIITLMTDFGTRDIYVGVMKGVILARCPSATLVDLTHEIPPQEIRAARYHVETGYSFFAPGTVHVIVVDPGVGSERRILAASAHGQKFVAPDNGVLTGVLEAPGVEDVVSVENTECFLEPVSQTFHGRDVMAPVAAELANGMDLGELGSRVSDWTTLPTALVTRDGGSVRGEVVHVDHFGNLVTNIEGDEVASDARIEVAGRNIKGLAESYASRPPGELLAIKGSNGRLEISVAGGNAGEILDAGYGMPVVVSSTS